jgi:CheY-like chemotaxis protein
MISKPCVILLIDDSEEDATLFRGALKRAGYDNRVVVLRSGDEAFRYLKGEAPYSDRASHPLPRLVLLDSRMPGIGGLELLGWMRLQDKLNGIPVIVLTDSCHGAEVRRAYGAGASAFVRKVSSLDQFRAQVKALADFWLRYVELPPAPGA